MKKCSNVSNNYRKSKTPKTSYIFFKKLGLSIVYSKCGHEYKKIFKEEESIKILGLITNISKEFRLKNIDETRNYFIEEINQNEFISKKRKKFCTASNYIEHLIILVTGCVSIPAFASLETPLGIKSSLVGSKIYAKTAGIKKYKSIIKKKKKKHDKIVKSKLNRSKFEKRR